MNQQLDLDFSTDWDDVAIYGFELINRDLNMFAASLDELYEYDPEDVEQQISFFDHSPDEEEIF